MRCVRMALRHQRRRAAVPRINTCGLGQRQYGRRSAQRFTLGHCPLHDDPESRQRCCISKRCTSSRTVIQKFQSFAWAVLQRGNEHSSSADCDMDEHSFAANRHINQYGCSAYSNQHPGSLHDRRPTVPGCDSDHRGMYDGWQELSDGDKHANQHADGNKHCYRDLNQHTY